MNRLQNVVLAALLGWFALASPARASESLQGTQAIFSGYWYLDPSTTCKLQMSNNFGGRRVVRPIFVISGQTSIESAPLEVGPSETVSLSLDQVVYLTPSSYRSGGEDWTWGDGTRPGSLWGSAILEGEVEGISAWIVCEDLAHSLATDSFFIRPKRGADLLETHWSTVGPRTAVLFSLLNVGDEMAVIHPVFYVDGREVTTPSFALGARKSVLLDLARLLPRTRYGLPTLGAARFLGNEGARLLGAQVVIDMSRGFSLVQGMRPPSSNSSAEYQAVGLFLGKPDAEGRRTSVTGLRPALLLSNLSATEQRAEVNLSLKRSGEGSEDLRSRSLVIGPWETKRFDLPGLASKAKEPLGVLSVRMKGSVPSAPLLVSGWSWDAQRNMVVPTTFQDPSETRMFRKILVAFDLSGGRTSWLVGRNSSLAFAVNYALEIRYREDGMNRIYLRSGILQPLETQIFDIRRIRDERIPDDAGNLLPPAVVSGTAFLSSSMPTLIAVDPTLDFQSGLSHLCNDACTGMEEPPVTGEPPDGPCPDLMTSGEIRTYGLDGKVTIDGVLKCKYFQCSSGVCAPVRYVNAGAGGSCALGWRTGWKIYNYFLGQFCVSVSEAPLASNCF